MCKLRIKSLQDKQTVLLAVMPPEMALVWVLPGAAAPGGKVVHLLLVASVKAVREDL